MCSCRYVDGGQGTWSLPRPLCIELTFRPKRFGELVAPPAPPFRDAFAISSSRSFIDFHPLFDSFGVGTRKMCDIAPHGVQVMMHVCCSRPRKTKTCGCEMR